MGKNIIGTKLQVDESAASTVIESILLFGITIVLIGMVLLSFQSSADRAREMVMHEEFMGIGGDVAKKIVDMDNEIKASLSSGTSISIENQIDLPKFIAERPYMITMYQGKLEIESIGSPHVIVEVPFNRYVNVVNGSTLYSTQAEYVLKYDSNGQIMFKNGGVDAVIDNSWPTISFLNPANGSNVSGNQNIQLETWDNIGVTRIEFFVDNSHIETVGYTGSPFVWIWDTTAFSDDLHEVMAIAYDNAGHYSTDSIVYRTDNGIDLIAPTGVIITPPDNSQIDFRQPLISATVSDNIAIDNSSITLTLDGIDKTANATITNTTLKEYTIEYTPEYPLSNTTHRVIVYAQEIYIDPKNVTLDWNFTVAPITDTTNPTVDILFPLINDDLVAGESISMQYEAHDDTAPDDSGIDYIVINVSDDGSYSDTATIQVTVDQVPVYSVTGTYNFPDVYQSSRTYYYNITVYDRAGYTAFKELTLSCTSSQASQISTTTTDADGKKDKLKFSVSNNGATPVNVEALDVSWPLSSAKFKKFKIDGATKWSSGGLSSPASISFSLDTIDPSSTKEFKLEFKDDLNSGENVFITIYFNDGSHYDVTIPASP